MFKVILLLVIQVQALITASPTQRTSFHLPLSIDNQAPAGRLRYPFVQVEALNYAPSK